MGVFTHGFLNRSNGVDFSDATDKRRSLKHNTRDEHRPYAPHVEQSKARQMQNDAPTTSRDTAYTAPPQASDPNRPAYLWWTPKNIDALTASRHGGQRRFWGSGRPRAAGRPSKKMWGFAPRLFWKVSRPPGAAWTPQNRRFLVGQKIIYKLSQCDPN